MIEKAIIIATMAHQGQVDKAGEAYILHPIRVMLAGKSVKEKICGILHDVIEDTDITLEYLKNEGFSNEVLIALDALTKRNNESYDNFINRILANKLACKVKLADLYDNMELSRIKNPSENDNKRIEKYRNAEKQILNELKKEEELYIDLDQ